MGGSNFDQIAQAIMEQQQRLKLLEQENSELKKQLADLRAGRGLVIDICGTRFTMLGQPTAETSVQAEEEIPQIYESASLLDEEALLDAPTAVMAKVDNEAVSGEEYEMAEQTVTSATFLEEIMLDEFSSAMSNPLATWSGPEQKQNEVEQASKTQKLDTRPEDLDEEQKAALRRELMGSFLLE